MRCPTALLRLGASLSGIKGGGFSSNPI